MPHLLHSVLSEEISGLSIAVLALQVQKDDEALLILNREQSIGHVLPVGELLPSLRFLRDPALIL